MIYWKKVFSNIRVDVEPSLMGYKSEAIILIKARPDAANQIAKTLSELKHTLPIWH